MGFLFYLPTPSHIGIVGLGGGSLPKYCYAHIPDAQILVAENDPEVIALREHFLIPKDSARFEVQCIDGADFVINHPQSFDVLLINGFDHYGQPPQLCTEDFYQNCFNSLKEDGVLAINLLEFNFNNAHLIDRISRVFQNHIVIVDALDSTNIIVFGLKGAPRSLEQKDLQQRLKELKARHTVGLARTLQRIGNSPFPKILRDYVEE